MGSTKKADLPTGKARLKISPANAVRPGSVLNLNLKKGGILTVAIRLPLQTEACRRPQPNFEYPANTYKV